MYGQGNYAPQFGQSPNRPPRPPFMQQQASHGSAPTGLLQQGPSVSPNGQQSAHTAQYFSPLLPPSSRSRVPPPPPPPPPQNQNIYRHPIHQPSPSLQQISAPHSALPLPPPPSVLSLQGSSVPPLPPSPQPFPPPPPPSSSTDQPDCDPCFSQAVTLESVQNIVTRDTKFTIRASDPNDASVEGGLSSIPIHTTDVATPPPRPTNEKTLRNIEILCQYISQNGPAFEDMARQKESGNSAFQFLFGGEPGSEAATERKYYLWMKNKLCPGQYKSNILLKNKHEENSSSVEPNKEASYPVIDSDMDMEDDIIQPCEETDIHDQMGGLKHESVSSVDDIEKGDQNNVLESLHGVTSTTYKEPAIELRGNDGGRSNNMTVCTKTQTEDPFKLLKDYSSDESSEFDALEPVSTLQLHEAIAVASDHCKTQDVDASLAHEISANELIPGPSSVESKSDIAVDNNVRADASKQSDFHDLEETDKDLRECTKSSASVKVDEFGRLIREGGSETDSDDSRHYRRRGRSRSSPKRRRRSPRRRKERRSLSRSWSPKRRRSRSRSPLRRPIESGSQKNARGGRHQTGECFNFLKGRCYRGASCKYLHGDPDKHGESRQYRSKLHASGTRTSSRDYDRSEENKVTTRKGSPDNGRKGKELQDDQVKDGDLMAKQKEHAGSAYSSKGSIVDEKDKAKDVSDLFNSNLQKAKEHSQAKEHSSCMPSEAMVSPCKNSVELSGQKDLSSSNSTAFNYPNHVSHLQQPLSLPLLPPPPPSLHAATVPPIPQPIQHTQFHPPQNMPWGNFPLQRPPYMLTPPLHSGPASFQQGSFLGNHLGQPVAGSLNSTSARDDPFSSSLSSGPFPSSSLGEPNPNRGQYFAHGNLPSGEPSSSGFQNPPYLHQQPYGLYQAAGNNFRDPSHFSVDLHKNNPDTGSRITAHHNPYASAFDEPLGSNFKSDVFRQGNNLSGVPFEDQNVAYGVSPVIPSPHSSKAGCQTLARSGEDQYDPLFDSIEPSAETLKKQVEQIDRAADNSDIMLRLSGSGPVDVNYKGKKNLLGADSAATSSETDEFGETAHPEVIAVEAGSQSNLNDSAEGSAGDVEINQVKREGKSKRNTDSRSMKHFKLALASFVKDMLKPSWRQGNMSKEAFKTIVKKTVEKVSGAMKGHRVPKSKANIDQYIDRSQRKLTALVEGYVNKYAK